MGRWVIFFGFLLASMTPLAADMKETAVAKFLEKLPQDDSVESQKMRTYFAGVPADSLYPFIQGVCDGMKKGQSPQSILDNYYQFWGVAASNALYKAALQVVCPPR